MAPHPPLNKHCAHTEPFAILPTHQLTFTLLHLVMSFLCLETNPALPLPAKFLLVLQVSALMSLAPRSLPRFAQTHSGSTSPHSHLCYETKLMRRGFVSAHQCLTHCKCSRRMCSYLNDSYSTVVPFSSSCMPPQPNHRIPEVRKVSFCFICLVPSAMLTCRRNPK